LSAEDGDVVVAAVDEIGFNRCLNRAAASSAAKLGDGCLFDWEGAGTE
jgi:hypothetical protein